MSAAELAAVVAAGCSTGSVLVVVAVVRSLRRQVRALERVVDHLAATTVPLVADAHRVVGQAATELERVGAVLEQTGSVAATVDSASRLAYRAFANPVVKVLAVGAGASSGVRQLRRARPERRGAGRTSRGGR
jgi:hypothetical protein